MFAAEPNIRFYPTISLCPLGLTFPYSSKISLCPYIGTISQCPQRVSNSPFIPVLRIVAAHCLTCRMELSETSRAPPTTSRQGTWLACLRSARHITLDEMLRQSVSKDLIFLNSTTFLLLTKVAKWKWGKCLWPEQRERSPSQTVHFFSTFSTWGRLPCCVQSADSRSCSCLFFSSWGGRGG